MESKIKRISIGEFEKEQTEILFSTDQIVMRVGEGELYEGSFIIENQKDGDIRGLVYSSSFRVRSMEQGFEGNPVVIHYLFESMGMHNGDVENGKFSIICNGGEYEIPFTAQIEKPYIMTDYGKIQSLSDFTELAKMSYEDAGKVFWSKKFADVLIYEDGPVGNLYANMRTWSLDDLAMEEFLVGSGEKARLEYSFQKNRVTFENYAEQKEETITIRKNTWGSLLAKLYTDGDFIILDKTELSTGDFTGSEYILSYKICSEKLHDGYNYGKIILETMYGIKEFFITVHQEIFHKEDHGKVSKLNFKFLRNYMDLVSDKINTEIWTEKGVEISQQLRDADPQNEIYLLIQAHVYLHAEKYKEAKAILDQYHYNKFDLGKKTEIKLYYLYLLSLVNKNEAAIKKMAEDIGKAYSKNPGSWILFCLLLHTDQKYQNCEERLEFIQEKFKNGSRHMMFYIEAYICYKKDNSLLKKLGSFEIEVLRFAAKYGIITKEMAMYTASLASHEKIYQEKLCSLLMESYEIFEEPMMLTAICMLLIKGNKIGTLYFPWYERALFLELKISQLYEYYMYSIDEKQNNQPLPRSIYLYFMHGNALDYRKTAYLYANILLFEDENSELFETYFDEIEKFAWDQISKRHINENLRILYKYFCCKDEIELDRMEAIYDIWHAYRVYALVPHIQYILVIEKDGEIYQRVPYSSEDGAQIYLYNNHARIILEAADGFHYTEQSACYLERQFQEPEFENLCMYYEKIIHNYADTYKLELSLDTIRFYGIDHFGEEEVLNFCVGYICENEEKEDDFLLYLCVELLKRGFYDKKTLQYMVNFYCASTKDMYQVWLIAKENAVPSEKLSERIITQMLFSEDMILDEEIFYDYYEGEPYFRLILGYLAYRSKEYVVYEKELSDKMIQIALNEYSKIGQIADVCKIAVLKFFSSRQQEEELKPVLRKFLREMCEKQLIFDFYMQYEEGWLQEVLLYDKTLISYHAQEGGRVRISYTIKDKDGKKVVQQTDQAAPVYFTIYTKEFILYEGEELEYTFQEYIGRTVVHEESGSFKQDRILYETGKYGRLNYMSTLQEKTLQEELRQYIMEENLANELFVLY